MKTLSFISRIKSRQKRMRENMTRKESVRGEQARKGSKYHGSTGRCNCLTLSPLQFRAWDKSSKLRSGDFCFQVSIFPTALISCCLVCLCVLLQCLVAPWGTSCHFTSRVILHTSKARQWPELLVAFKYFPQTHTHLLLFCYFFI